jgi:hypothetical protein
MGHYKSTYISLQLLYKTLLLKIQNFVHNSVRHFIHVQTIFFYRKQLDKTLYSSIPSS